MDVEEIKRILWMSGLKNAVEFDGKPDKKAVMNKLMAQNKDLRTQAKTILPILDQIIEEISKLSIDEQKDKLLSLDAHALDKKESKVEEKILPELPNFDKYDKIIMRMAPYPSGALHIGNARMVVLNDAYVKRHNGELILFYDDTIGSPKALKETPKAKFVIPEAYDLIKEGLEWLGVKYSKVFYKSDRLKIYYEYCEKMIKEGVAYVCFCSGDEFREKYKNKKKECPHRNHSAEKNLEEWNNMLNRKYRETEAVVRMKTGMDHKDPALRDQIIMRISEAEHPRVGNKYIIWPMLEFSWAIDDHLIGASHILRGSDLVKEDVIEEFVWDFYKWKKAEFLHYGKLNFPDIKLSKTEARTNIQSGKYDGWDDPRTWSLQSLKKRGIRPEALKEALLDLGMSINSITFATDWLYSKNRALIDEVSDRYFFVEDPVTIIIDNVSFKEYIAEPLLLPTNPNKGKRKIRCTTKNNQLNVHISLSDAKELMKDQIFRLKDLMNVQVKSLDLKKKLIQGTFHSKELNREYSIIQWVPDESKIKVKVLKPDGFISNGLGEINLKKIPINTPIQFERYGFVNPIKLENDELYCYYTHY